VTTTTTLKFTALATTTQGSPAGVEFAGLAFDLDAYQGGALVPGFTFSVPATITLDYGQGDVAGLDENTLVLETWTGSGWQDAACGPYERNPGENWLSVPVCHLSRFALFGERGITFHLGEPGLSFRYVETFGVTEVPYLVDTTHINRPWGLFIDDSDNLYVVEEKGYRLLRYNSAGVNTLALGKAGVCYTDDYVLCTPQDVVLDGSGSIWVADGQRVVQYDAGGTFLQQQPESDPWEPGSDNERFDDVHGVAFDSGGRMYVSDTDNHRVQVYTFSGGSPIYSTTIGVTDSPGSGDSHFNSPYRLAIDGSDRLYVVDRENDRVQCCTFSGGWSCTTFASGLNNPQGIAIDSSDNVYIADTENGRIRKCSSGGVCNDLVTGTYWLYDVAVDSSGNVYGAAAYEAIVVRYNSSGELLGTFVGVEGVPYLTDGYHYNQPRVAIDRSDNLIVVEDNGHRLLKLDANGTPLWTVGVPGRDAGDNAHFSYPHGVAVDNDGDIYVADGCRVQIFSGSGTYVATLGTGCGTGDYEFYWVAGVAVDDNGYIYVSDASNHRIQIYDGNRVFVGRIGATGQCGSALDRLCWPIGLEVDSAGSIYVADAGNARVQKFSSNRQWQMTLGTPGSWGDDFSQFDGPEDIAIDSEGRIYVAEWCNRVQVFDSGGAYLTTIGGAWGTWTSQFRGASGVDIDSDGNVYIADFTNARIQKFAPGVPGWEQVNINGFGDRNNSLVWSLEVFGGQLYAGASNWGSGASIWRTADGTSWNSVSGLGFGTLYTNTNPAILDMIVFNSQLYASTGWDGVGGQLWRSSDGAAWEQVEGNGFGDATNGAIAALGVFNNTLYATTHSFTSAHGLEIWRSSTGDSGDWSRVVADGNGNANNYICTGLIEFRGHLYAAVENAADGAEVWRTSDGIAWTRVVTGGFGDADNTQMGGFAIFGDYLYVGTRNETAGAQLYRSSDGTTWEQMADDGFDDPNNVKIESLMAFSGYLYAGADNGVTGLEVWRSSDGVAGTQINSDGFGDSNNTGTLWSAATVAFNNRLYIGTQNDANGGEIWKRTVTADFTASPTEGSPPIAVVFTNTSAGDYTQAWWDYGDGRGYTGTLLLPAHVYSETGSYTVSLTVSDGVDTSTLVRPDYIRVGCSVYLPMVVRGYQ
jgi:uncharacterized protein YjiK